MSTTSGPNMAVVVCLGGVGVTYTVLHAWRFDRCRCLLPRKKDWFRVLLTYMLLVSFMGMLIWGTGWCYVKYKLGWVTVPGYGSLPVPPEMWTEEYKDLNLPFTFWNNLAYSLQVSLNAEEGLYWYHLMRAVRQPNSAKAWVSSSFFFSWIAISILGTATTYSATWAAFVDIPTQQARNFATGGAMELIVVLASSVVVFKFPSFLKDVKASGAGPEVRSRLHFYHEGNKVRTLCRLIFSLMVVLLGADGLTEAKRINSTPLVADLMHQVAFISYFFGGIISVMLYLPRNWSSTANPGGNVMVGRREGRGADEVASNALMSLLREGGRWDEIDDARVDKSTKAFEEYCHKGNWDQSEPSLQAPRALENFTSPFGVGIEEAPPKQLRIMVEQEVHKDFTA